MRVEHWELEEICRPVRRGIPQAYECRRAAHRRVHSQILGDLEKLVIRGINQLLSKGLENTFEACNALMHRYFGAHVSPSLSKTRRMRLRAEA